MPSGERPTVTRREVHAFRTLAQGGNNLALASETQLPRNLTPTRPIQYIGPIARDRTPRSGISRCEFLHAL